MRGTECSIPSFFLAALAAAALALICAVPANARWQSGNENPDIWSEFHTCRDGVMFQFADIASVGERHPHPRPAESPNSLTYQVVATIPGETPAEDRTVLDQPLTVPYRQIDILGITVPGTAPAHREYSGAFTLNWSEPLERDTTVLLSVYRDGQLVEEVEALTVGDCNLPVESPGCGDVITEDTTLQGDLVDCIKGVVIGADDITLDLNGHTIDGISVGPSRGVDNSAGHDGVTIENGTIREFDVGVEIIGATDSRVSSLSLAGNETDVELMAASGSRLSNLTLDNDQDGIVLLSSDRNRLEGNAGDVILGNSHQNQVRRSSGRLEIIASHDNRIEDATGGEGIGLEGSERNRLTRNAVSSITLTGSDGNRVDENVVSDITLLRSNGNRVDGNTVSGSGSFRGIGIELELATGNRVERNTVSGKEGSGISLFAGDGNRVERNVVSNNARNGIELVGSDNRVERNSAFMNGLAGIALSHGSDNLLTRNSTLNNSVGIEVAPGFLASLVNNRIEWNSASGNAEDGIRISVNPNEAIPTGTEVVRNIANQNGDDGIDVDSPSTTLIRNTASNNVDLGIEAVIGVTDGGGNRARGNGDPAQCTGVVCS